jgi:hypothetical protein
VSVPLSKAHLQTGDLVAVVDDRYLSYGKDGITNTDKFEIVSREVSITGDSPQVELVLFYAAAGTPSISGRTRPRPGSGFGAQQSADTDDVAQKWVPEGLSASRTGVLKATVVAGTASSGASQFGRLHEDVEFDVVASKDTWISIDATTSSLSSHPVANGAPEPDKPASQAWIAKVVSDGVDVTGVTDLRAVKPVPGAKLVDLSVVSGKIGPNAVIAGKLADGAVDTSGRFANGVVSSGAIADSAVTPAKSYNKQLTIGVVRNSTFTKWRTI